jgi:hypothetical protein
VLSHYNFRQFAIMPLRTVAEMMVFHQYIFVPFELVIHILVLLCNLPSPLLVDSYLHFLVKP